MLSNAEKIKQEKDIYVHLSLILVFAKSISLQNKRFQRQTGDTLCVNRSRSCSDCRSQCWWYQGWLAVYIDIVLWCESVACQPHDPEQLQIMTTHFINTKHYQFSFWPFFPTYLWSALHSCVWWQDAAMTKDQCQALLCSLTRSLRSTSNIISPSSRVSSSRSHSSPTSSHSKLLI